MYIYMCVCVCVYIYIYIYIHTYVCACACGCVFQDSCLDSQFSEDNMASMRTSFSICIAFFIEASNATFNSNIF